MVKAMLNPLKVDLSFSPTMSHAFSSSIANCCTLLPIVMSALCKNETKWIHKSHFDYFYIDCAVFGAEYSNWFAAK